MKTLVVYYSLDGNTKFIAEAIASELGADILALRPKKEVPKNFLKFIWGGRQVMLAKKPELESLDKPAGDYDLIILGTPVWVGTFAPPIRSFLAQSGLKGKKLALFCTFGGNEGKTFTELRAGLEGNEILSQIGFHQPLKYDQAGDAAKAKEWAKGLANV